MNVVGPFQLRIFYDFMILFYDSCHRSTKFEKAVQRKAEHFSFTLLLLIKRFFKFVSVNSSVLGFKNNCNLMNLNKIFNLKKKANFSTLINFRAST